MASPQATQQFAQAVLNDLGVPDTPQNRSFIIGWSRAEGTAAKNNPLATTLALPGSVPLPGNSAGVQQYPTIAEGAQATAATIGNGRYPNIVAALRTGGAVAHSFGNTGVYSDLNTWVSGRPSPAVTGYVRNVLVGIQGGGTSISATDLGSFDLGNAASAAGAVAQHVPGVAQVESVTGFIGRLTDPAYILRGLEIVAGAILVLLGLYLLARQVGLGGFEVPSTLSPTAREAEQAAASVQAEQTARRAAREEAQTELARQRVKTEQARATELRTRVKHRRRTKAEQQREIDRAYIRGAAETSPLA